MGSSGRSETPIYSFRPEDQGVGVELLRSIEALHKAGKNSDVLRLTAAIPQLADRDVSLRIRLVSAMARFDLGDVVGSVAELRAASAAEGVGLAVRFAAAFAHFLRESDFLEPSALLPLVAQLRQLAARVGDADSLASLHLAVARVEGQRGHCLTARHHLELARLLAERTTNDGLQVAVDLVDASLESLAGNLRRAKALSVAGLEHSLTSGVVKYEFAALTNLSVIALYEGRFDTAEQLLDRVLSKNSLTYVRLGALDTLAQLELRRGNFEECLSVLEQCQDAITRDAVPARSWYDLAHQVTRCSYFERIGAWSTVVDIAQTTDAELEVRQYKSVRVSLLGAQARALARLGNHASANLALTAAVRDCPRGAIEPLIVLEASKALCTSLRGQLGTGRSHYDRALAACRAIGHRYHEGWITEQRDDVLPNQVVFTTAPLDAAPVSMLLNDVATALGAGHSIDILSHRIIAIVQGTSLGPRIEVSNESGLEYIADPTAEFETTLDGSATIRMRGSDRRTTLTIKGAESLEEMSLLKSVTDLVQMAVARTTTSGREDDLSLWPRAADDVTSDTIFRSPRMVELLRIAERLATTTLPVLITGETGTGKEVFARLIHERSANKRGPFVPFNCSAVSRELVESQLFGHRRGAFTGAIDSSPGFIRTAEHGTLFLDEIGDLELTVQPKLLRFLESSEIQPVGEPRPQRVNVRIIAATNSSLDAMIRDGRFRPDLYYRIGVAPLELPPLRERKDEIPAFASVFLTRYAAECGRANLRLADDFIAALLLYDWPGNIRQLANEIRRAAAMATDGQVLRAVDLAPEITANWNARATLPSRSTVPAIEIRLDQPLAKAIDELERKFIEQAMSASNGRLADAAEILGLSRKGLFLKRRRRGLVSGTES
jgi:transcriptional regulator with PAS, ATPase and Fis domain